MINWRLANNGINKLKNFSQMLVEFYIFVPSVTNSDITYVIQNRGFYTTNCTSKHLKNVTNNIIDANYSTINRESDQVILEI